MVVKSYILNQVEWKLATHYNSQLQVVEALVIRPSHRDLEVSYVMGVLQIIQVIRNV